MIRSEPAATLPISLAYAPSATTQYYIEMQVLVGTSLIEALNLTGWLIKDRELAKWCQTHQTEQKIDKKTWRVGVFSEKQPLTYVLNPHDRVEVYRSLILDPMRKRKTRATQQQE